MAMATKFFFDMINSSHTMAMVFGDACSSVSGPMAEIAKEWSVWLLSYADTDPALSDRKKYANFYRTVPSESDFNPARLALLRKYNWTHVGTIFQGVSKRTARFGQAHNNLVSVLEKGGITILKSVGFVNDPEKAIMELKDADVRIILGNFDSSMARYVFCQAYVHKMYGHKYQWIILGGYPDGWWTLSDPDLDCSPTELSQAIDGYIATDILPLSSGTEPTESGLTPQDYLRKYVESNKGNYSKFHAYAFDGVWTIAKLADEILKTRVNTTSHLNSSLFRGQVIPLVLNKMRFEGVSGLLKFRGGDRPGSVLLEQFQGNDLVKIGEYQSYKDKLRNCTNISWHGVGPPLDGKMVQIKYVRVPGAVYLAMSSLACLGLIMSTFFLIINITFREHKYIKMSSPNLNNVVIIGCLLAYTSVLLLGVDGGITDTQHLGIICYTRAWVLSVGFTLAFGAMFSKTWRVHSIFTDVKLHKKVIRDTKLFLIVTILLITDALILVAWHVLDPMKPATRKLSTHVLVDRDLDIIFVMEYCTSVYITSWLGFIYAYKGLLLVVGCFLAWETRHVSIPALNDSKYIGMSVYNVVIMCVCGAAVTFVISDKPIPSFVIIGLFIIFCTTITLCLLFVPKLIEIRHDPSGQERKVRTKLKKHRSYQIEDDNGSLARRNDELLKENIRYRTIISEKLTVLMSLMEQLGEKNISDQLYFVNQTIHVDPKNTWKLNAATAFGSFVSDIDISECSDISYDGSTSWEVGANPSQRVQLKIAKSANSMFTSIDDLFDEPSMVNQRKHTALDKKDVPDTTDNDSDEFGGVYLGPPESLGKKPESPVKLESLQTQQPNTTALPTDTEETHMNLEILEHKPQTQSSLHSSLSEPEDEQEANHKESPLSDKETLSILEKRRRFRSLSFLQEHQSPVFADTFNKQLHKQLSESDAPSIDKLKDEKHEPKASISCGIIEQI